MGASLSNKYLSGNMIISVRRGFLQTIMVVALTSNYVRH